MENTLERRASRIKLLLMDCDGVLTNGRLQLLDVGDEQKWFSVRDGLGLELWHRAGLKSGIVSGRSSRAVERRAKELQMAYVRQGSENKIKAFDEIIKLAGVSDEQVAYIGDDLNDIPLMRRSELAIAVSDAAPETQEAAHYITASLGGNGAVREAIEMILRAQGKWNDLIEKYLRS